MEKSELSKINGIAIAKLLHFFNTAMETSESVNPIVADLDICISPTVVNSEFRLCTTVIAIGQHS